MYRKLEKQILLRLSFGLLGFCLAGGVATAECLLDSRIIDVTRQDGEPRQTVRLLRVHRGQHVMHEKTNETANQLMKWDCRQAADSDSTSCSAEYEAPVGTLPGQWWASYVAEAPVSGTTRRELLLRMPADEDITYASSGNWTFSRRVESDGRVALRWVGTEADRKTCATDAVPWVLVGSRTTWSQVGEGLRAIAETDPLTPERQAAAQAGGQPAALISVFDGFHREKPTPGFQPRPLAEFFADRSGTCKEFSSALLSLLEVRGEPAWIVYRASGMNDLADAIPCPDIFDHILVAIQADDGVLLLDAFAGRAQKRSDILLSDEVQAVGNHLFVPWQTGCQQVGACVRRSATEVSMLNTMDDFGVCSKH